MTKDCGTVYRGRTLAEGKASGEAVVLDEPLSFWGGVEPETGVVKDRRHSQAGVRLAGRILVMPSGRGSSSSSSVLAEAIRRGVAPLGIVLRQPDGILALGAMVAAELYGIRTPVVVLEEDYDALYTGARVAIEACTDSATICVD